METAEDLINWLESVSNKLPKTVRDHLSINIKGYAKSHVKAALIEASEKAKITLYADHRLGPSYKLEDPYINKDSILNAYPKENIK